MTKDEFAQKYGVGGGSSPGSTTPPQGEGNYFGGNILPNAGGITGGLLGNILGPAGAAVGAGAGYGTGYGMRRSIDNLLGRNEGITPQQDASQFFGGSAKAAGTAGSLSMALWSLGLLANPLDKLGKLRSALIGNGTVPSQGLQDTATENMQTSPYYQAVTPEGKAAAKNALSRFITTINPNEETGVIPTNDVYSKLSAFDTANRAYGRGTDFPSATAAQGANLSSRAVREFLNTQTSTPVHLVNDLYGKVAGMQDNPLFKYRIPAALLGAAMYRGIPALLRKFQQGGQ